MYLFLPCKRITKEKDSPDSHVTFSGRMGCLFDGNVQRMLSELDL
jgi:hypothetical protein